MFDIFLVSSIILAWFGLLSIVWQLALFEYFVSRKLESQSPNSAFIMPAIVLHIPLYSSPFSKTTIILRRLITQSISSLPVMPPLNNSRSKFEGSNIGICIPLIPNIHERNLLAHITFYDFFRSI